MIQLYLIQTTVFLLEFSKGKHTTVKVLHRKFK